MFRRRADAGSVGESIAAVEPEFRPARSSKKARYRRTHARAIPRPLQHPVFFRVWTVSALAYLARFTDYTVVAWLAVQHWDSPLAIGFLIFFRYSPFFIIGPFVGLMADRFPRILVVRVAQFGIGSSALLFGLLLTGGFVPLWVLYLYVFLNGTLFLVEMPARRTYFSGVVGRSHITSALALDMISLNAAWFIGSNVAGLLLSGVEPGFVYIGIGAIGLLNVGLLRGLPILFRPTADERTEGFFTSFGKGLRFVRGNRVVVGLLLAVGVTNMTGFTFESMIAIIAREQFDAGPLLFGVLVSAQGIGSLVVATLLATSRSRYQNHGSIVLFTSVAMHLLAAVLTLIVWAPVGFLLLVIVGMFSMAFSIMHNSMLLMVTPNRMRGRILGIQAVVLGLFPVGSLGLGFLAELLSPGGAIQVVALGGLALLLVIALCYPELRRPTQVIQ